MQARTAAPCECPRDERRNRPLAFIRNPPGPPQTSEDEPRYPKRGSTPQLPGEGPASATRPSHGQQLSGAMVPEAATRELAQGRAMPRRRPEPGNELTKTLRRKRRESAQRLGPAKPGMYIMQPLELALNHLAARKE
eukprot:6562921-Alexandrium_andersonii.AAC.1